MSTLCITLMLVAGGCKESTETPEGALRSFLSDLRARKGAEAWRHLSRSTQQAIEEDAAAVAKAIGGQPEKDPAKLLFDRAELVVLNDAEAISVASRLGDTVNLLVAVEGGKSATLKMVREEGVWKVDLIKSVQPLEQKFENVEAEPPNPDEEARTATAAP